MVIALVVVICLRVTKLTTLLTVNGRSTYQLCVLCARVSSGAADGQATLEDGAHSCSVSNITEPEVESQDCVG